MTMNRARSAGSKEGGGYFGGPSFDSQITDLRDAKGIKKQAPGQYRKRSQRDRAAAVVAGEGSCTQLTSVLGLSLCTVR